MPIRTGLSPRAVMTNGAATCDAATNPAALRMVRRSSLAKVGSVMRHLPLDLLLIVARDDAPGAQPLTSRVPVRKEPEDGRRRTEDGSLRRFRASSAIRRLSSVVLHPTFSSAS